MKYDFYTLTHNNAIIAASNSKSSLYSLLAKLEQNPKHLKALIQHKRVIVLPENDNKAQKLIDSIKE